MKYLISIKRLHDGEQVGKVVDDFEVDQANIDVIAMRANELWKLINQLPERRSTLQYGQQFEPLNPREETPFMKKLRGMAKTVKSNMTPYEREQCEKMERLQRDALLYGRTSAESAKAWVDAAFPNQTLNTFEESGVDNGNDPQTD